jgi:hypothetical protein
VNEFQLKTALNYFSLNTFGKVKNLTNIPIANYILIFQLQMENSVDSSSKGVKKDGHHQLMFESVLELVTIILLHLQLLIGSDCYQSHLYKKTTCQS